MTQPASTDSATASPLFAGTRTCTGTVMFAMPGTDVNDLVHRLDYTSQFIYFVRDHVLTASNHEVPEVPQTERGGAADQWLVNEAARLNVPLVSNEGLKEDLTRAPKRRVIRKMADAAGVIVLTPREVSTARWTSTAVAKDFCSLQFDDIASRRDSV